jgi:hypothetical protein
VKRRVWILIVLAVLIGGVLTWLAFGVGLQDKPPPDVTNGVELVEPRDRTSR